MNLGLHFRAGVGCVIYNQEKEVAIFSRSDNPNIWQFQQGGMDEGETVEQTLWRELFEETALTRADFLTITPYTNWTVYEYPAEMKHSNRLGQAHAWFFLELAPGTIIDLQKAQDKEFLEVAFVPFSEFVETPHTFKAHVYQELYAYFIKHFLTR